MNDTENAHFKSNGALHHDHLSFLAVTVMFTEATLIQALSMLSAEFDSTATWTAWISFIR